MIIWTIYKANSGNGYVAHREAFEADNSRRITAILRAKSIGELRYEMLSRRLMRIDAGGTKPGEPIEVWM
jgi:hypothetical protein